MARPWIVRRCRTVSLALVVSLGFLGASLSAPAQASSLPDPAPGVQLQTSDPYVGHAMNAAADSARNHLAELSSRDKAAFQQRGIKILKSVRGGRVFTVRTADGSTLLVVGQDSRFADGRSVISFGIQKQAASAVADRSAAYADTYVQFWTCSSVYSSDADQMNYVALCPVDAQYSGAVGTILAALNVGFLTGGNPIASAAGGIAYVLGWWRLTDSDGWIHLRIPYSSGQQHYGYVLNDFPIAGYTAWYYEDLYCEAFWWDAAAVYWVFLGYIC